MGKSQNLNPEPSQPFVSLRQRAIRDYWDSIPCGSTEVSPKLAPAAFFEEHARVRYQREPQILELAEFEKWRGRRVLEIGVGMGADFSRFRRAGAQAAGIDLSFRSLGLARQNARAQASDAPLAQADAEALPFRPASFDLVYAWGVLHHTFDTAQALREIHRVLKPGGECRAMLYHRSSLVGLQAYLCFGLMKGRPFSSVGRLVASHIQSPGAQAFTGREAAALFRDFEEVTIQPTLTAYDLRWSRRGFWPRWTHRLVPSRWGWFLLVRAHKPQVARRAPAASPARFAKLVQAGGG
jgi:SAM-dependent methyltransferase